MAESEKEALAGRGDAPDAAVGMPSEIILKN
jgi:hypothetical protein